jgi:hypothetical protein
LRVSDCSAVSTWSSWTGPLAWLIGRRSPSPRTGADGEPGLTSTKKLPSRKMRGRIFTCASLWIGRPLLSMRIFTTAACAPLTCSTPLTLPMSTPAMRTGEPGRMLFADGKTASIV